MLQLLHQCNHLRSGQDFRGVRDCAPSWQQDEPPDPRVQQQILNRVIIKQVIGQTETVFQAKDLVYCRILKVRIHQQHGLRCFHGKTDRQIDGRQGFPFSIPGTRYTDDIPSVFPKSLCDLGSKDFIGVDECPLLVCGHHAMPTQNRVWNAQRSGLGIRNRRRYRLGGRSPRGLTTNRGTPAVLIQI